MEKISKEDKALLELKKTNRWKYSAIIRDNLRVYQTGTSWTPVESIYKKLQESEK